MGPWNGNSDGNRQRSLLLGFYIGPEPCAPRHVKGCFILGAVLTGTVVRSEWFTLEGWFNISSTDCAYPFFFSFCVCPYRFLLKSILWNVCLFLLMEKEKQRRTNITFLLKTPHSAKNLWCCGLWGMESSFPSQHRRLPRVQRRLQVGCTEAKNQPRNHEKLMFNPWSIAKMFYLLINDLNGFRGKNKTKCPYVSIN